MLGMVVAGNPGAKGRSSPIHHKGGLRKAQVTWALARYKIHVI